MNKSIIALTQGINEPSARFRWEQYIENFHLAGFQTETLPSLYGAYAPSNKIQRPLWLGKTLLESFNRVQKTKTKYDLCFLQRNLVATLPTWESLIYPPYVFDVDDAIFINDRFSSSKIIAKKSILTICGNEFLADHYKKFSKVEVVPTAVNTKIFTPKEIKNNEITTIGWSGSSSGLPFLYEIEDSLKMVLESRKNTKLIIISDKKPQFKKISPDKIIYIKWKKSNEVSDLKNIDIGLMPLKDDLWSQGKCSYKMLTYMAIGIPIVVSPIGMNKKILASGDIGFAPKNDKEWLESLITLIDNRSLQKTYGRNGRVIIENEYSTNIISKKLISIFNSLI